MRETITETETISINDAVEKFYLSISGVLSKSTVNFYKSRLPSFIKYFGANTYINSITTNDLREWRASILNKTTRYQNHPYRKQIKGGLSLFTLHQYIRCVKRLFRWLKEEGVINKNPAARLELPPLPVSIKTGISERDRDEILKACEKSENSIRDLAVCLFLADTAARVAGVSGLRLCDLDMENQKAIVYEKGMGGNNKPRIVFFGAKTKSRLQRWMEERKKYKIDCEYVFLSTKGDRFTESAIYQMLRRRAKQCGIKHGFNPHNWRHGAIRGMLSRGLSLAEAAQIAGHSSVTVTGDIYGRFADSQLQKRHAKTSWLSDE